MIAIYHNPRCGKSRQTLKLMQEKNASVKIIEYLKTPPSQADLKIILKKLGLKAEAVVRKNEAVFKEKFKGKILSEAQWIKALAENPLLMERPIVVKGNKAVIGRPPENVLSIL